MPAEHDVRSICLSLPGVTERLSWQQPAWFARTLMARMWEDGVLTVKSEEREALAETDPRTFYWTPHHNRSPLLVLVRLEAVDETELRELLLESYRLAGPLPPRYEPVSGDPRPPSDVPEAGPKIALGV